MNYYHRNQSSNSLLFLAGLAIGAIVGPSLKRKFQNNDRWQDMKDKFTDKYEQTRDKTQSVYNDVVDEVTDKYAKARGISRNELTDLVDDLKMHWGRIKQAWNE